MYTMNLHLIRAVVTAAVATMPMKVRQNFASEDDLTRMLHEDVVVKRIMDALRETERQSSQEEKADR